MIPRESWSTDDVVRIAVDCNTGELVINGFTFKPNDHPKEQAADIGTEIYDTLDRLRTELFYWRCYAARMKQAQEFLSCIPDPPKP